jgi:FkbM family methyltransferase
MIKNLIYYYKIVGLPGVISALKAKLLNSIIVFNVSTKNNRRPIYLRIPSADIKVFEKVFLDQEYSFNENSTPKIILDIGAHIGLATIYFANKYPDARIIAIEPEKNNYEMLKKNVALYEKVIPIHAAVWNEDKEIDVVDTRGGNWGFITEEKQKARGTNRLFCHKVNGITIKKIIKDYNIQKIDILKMDIEGAEKEVFSDASKWINKVDILIIELHEHLKPGCRRSFYKATNDFKNEWIKGENIYLSR